MNQKDSANEALQWTAGWHWSFNRMLTVRRH
jgi:hypothetical protein